MKEQRARIHMASEQLTAVCNELDRLARRIESIRNVVLTSAATAAAAATTAAAAPGPQSPARGTSSPPTIQKELPSVPGLTTRPEVIAKVKAALRLAGSEAKHYSAVGGGKDIRLSNCKRKLTDVRREELRWEERNRRLARRGGEDEQNH